MGDGDDEKEAELRDEMARRAKWAKWRQNPKADTQRRQCGWAMAIGTTKVGQRGKNWEKGGNAEKVGDAVNAQQRKERCASFSSPLPSCAVPPTPSPLSNAM